MHDWIRTADDVLAGRAPTKREAMDMLVAPDDDVLELLAAAFRVRRQHFGRTVRIHVLENAKSGSCTEDCSYCSQSIRFDTGVDRYAMESVDELVTGALRAAERGAVTYCMVTATRGPSARDLDTICEAVAAIKRVHPGLRICTSLGLISRDQAARLVASGVDRYNHNLETSPRFFPRVTTTHSFEDRKETVRIAKEAGMEACSGGIIGLGEELEDRVELAFSLRDLGVDSIPLNFLNPRPGTGLAVRPKLTPYECLRTLAMFRFVHPDRDVRIAGGRELCLGSMQPLALFAASSIFTDGYLTTSGQGWARDRAMLEEAGFTPVHMEPIEDVPMNSSASTPR